LFLLPLFPFLLLPLILLNIPLESLFQQHELVLNPSQQLFLLLSSQANHLLLELLFENLPFIFQPIKVEIDIVDIYSFPKLSVDFANGAIYLLCPLFPAVRTENALWLFVV
jgi:hypothetical protein